jgi:hypothetical protein
MLSYVMRNPRLIVLLFVLVALPAAFAHFLNAQTASADGPPSQPSSWFNQQTSEIGLAGFENTTAITSDGYLRTGFEELMFFSGPDLEPTSVSGHIVEQSGLPIVHYDFERDGIAYRFSIFAGKIDKGTIIRARQHAKFPFIPGFNIESGIIEPEVDFVRVDITNPAREPRLAVFASCVRYQDPKASGIPHNKDGEAFNPGWTNNFDDANFYRFNRDLYNFPSGYVDRSFTVRKNWSEPNPQYVLSVTRLSPAPTTPIGIVTYARELNPGETWALDFKMPLIPTADPFVISAIDDASLDAIEAQVHGEPATQH